MITLMIDVHKPPKSPQDNLTSFFCDHFSADRPLLPNTMPLSPVNFPLLRREVSPLKRARKESAKSVRGDAESLEGWNMHSIGFKTWY